jgi:hypothetical protein
VQPYDPKQKALREARPAKPGKSIRWIDLSVERRELGRAAALSYLSLLPFRLGANKLSFPRKREFIVR